MSNQPKRRATDTLDSQIGQAWALHFKKNHAEALTEFRQVLEKDPNHVDGLYGLGLVLSVLGNKDEARHVFGQALQLTEGKVSHQTEDEAEVARYTMLVRMIQQQIAKLG